MPSGKKGKKTKDSSNKPQTRRKSPSRSNSESQTASRSNSESQTASRSNSIESQAVSRSNSIESQTEVSSRSKTIKPTKQTTPAGALGVDTPPPTEDYKSQGPIPKTVKRPETGPPPPAETPKSSKEGKDSRRVKAKSSNLLDKGLEGEEGRDTGPPTPDKTPKKDKEVKPDFSKYHKDEENTDKWWNKALPQDKKKDSLITVFDGKIQTIGTGTFGTVFIKGQLDTNNVAVRRVLIDVRSKIARAPLKDLVVGIGKGHDNVLNLLGWKIDPGFVYFAHENCICSIEQLYVYGRPEPDDTKQYMSYNGIRIPKKTIAKNTIDGVCYLCELKEKPVFKHLKPSKVLVYKSGKKISCKVSDFGLSYQQVEDQVTSHRQATNENVGWMAPELLKIKYDLPDEHTADDTEIRQYLKDPRDRNRHQRMNDVKLITYSLGLFIFYIFNDGEHYWNKELKLRELNMIENNIELRSDIASNTQSREFFEVNEWVGQAVRYQKEDRPEPKDLKIYTFYWHTDAKIDFLRRVCEDLNGNNTIRTLWVTEHKASHKLYSLDDLEILKEKDKNLNTYKKKNNICEFLTDIHDYLSKENKQNQETKMDHIESTFPGIFAMIYIVTAKVLNENATVKSEMRKLLTGWHWCSPSEDEQKFKEELPFQTVKKQ